MPIFFKESKFYSEINGELTLRQCWNGSWTLLIPEGEWYGSSYLEKMWRVALKKFRNCLKPKNVLVLGAGAGCAIEVVRNLWPQSQVDAVDYDRTIVEIGKKIYKNFGNFNPSFIISDAALFVKNCDKKLASLKRERSGYDLIIVDLFSKISVSPLLKDKNFVSEISRILEKPGAVIANIATKLSGKDEEIFKVWGDIFPGARNFEFRDNLLLLAGTLSVPQATLSVAERSAIPEDYYRIFQTDFWAKFLQKRGLAVLGGEPRTISNELYGARRGLVCVWRLPFGLGIINAMSTDKEPDITALKNFGCRHGVIFWTPWEKKSARWPWLKSLIPLHQKGNGFSIVAPEYRKKWSEMARRNLKKFEASGVRIGSATADVFIEGLKSSTLKSSLKEGFASMIKDADLSSIELWIAKKDGKILGGLAVVNYAASGGTPPEGGGGNISAHFVAYSSKEGREFQVATGLIDNWFKYALEHNIKYLNFGHIRQKWEPFSWRGYSDFKRKFIDQEIRLTNGFWRLF